MEQSNLLDLAKQGEPDAIAALMNAVLEPKGIKTYAEREHDCLNILLESPKTLNQETLVAFIKKGLLELGSPSIRSVKAQSKKIGLDAPSWTQEFELHPILPDDLLWLNDPDVEVEEPDEPIELEEDSPLWLDDFEVELPADPEPSAEEVTSEGTGSEEITPEGADSKGVDSEGADSEGADSEAEEADEQPNGLVAFLKTYWAVYSIPILLIVVGAFITGGVAAFLSTSKAEQNRVEEMIVKPVEQTPEDKQQQAEEYLKAMNAAQEKFYQQNSRFANSLEELERSANLISQSYSYAYRLKVSDRSLISALPREAGLKSYVGGVFVTRTGTTTLICQTQKPSMETPPAPQFSAKSEVSCAPRSAKVQ
jgi:hypothetical protein